LAFDEVGQKITQRSRAVVCTLPLSRVLFHRKA